MRKPFWKKSHASWYCEIGRKQVRLGPDKDAAFEEYHKLMAGSHPTTWRTPVQTLVDQFLFWTQQKRAATTYDWYLRHCQSFVDFVGPRLTVTDVKPNHVTRWVDHAYKNCGPTYQNGAYRAISRAFNWAKRQGLIQVNPVAGVERPAAEPREAYLTPEQWEKAVALVDPADPFNDLLWFMHETGCRPNEARLVEARHWDRAKRRLILERKRSKGRKQRVVIRLNQRATEIVTRLALKRPEKPLFANKLGRPWTKDTVICRFTNLEEKLGFEFFPYILRHTWCTDALLRGVDPLTVAIFLNHSDATMVMRVYNHLVQQDEFLAEKLQQATGEDIKPASNEAQA